MNLDRRSMISAATQVTLATGLSASVSPRVWQRCGGTPSSQPTGMAKAGRPIPMSLLASYATIHVRATTEPVTPLPPGARAMMVTVPATMDSVVDIAVVPSSLLMPFSRVERPGEIVLLIQPMDASSFYTSDGRTVSSDVLRSAVQEGLSSLRLSRAEASSLESSRTNRVRGYRAVRRGRPLDRW